MLFGVQLCVARGLQELHVKSDSLGLVRILQGSQSCPWRLQWEVDELLSYKPYFREIMHCIREANKPADCLANLGADLEQESVFNIHSELPTNARGEIAMD